MILTERQVLERVDSVSVRQLRLWVSRGWIVPTQGDSGPVFDETDIARIRLVCELRRDMHVNEDAVPVVLTLMDQLYGIRCEFRTLMHAIGDQPQQVQEGIREAYRIRRERRQ